MKKILVTGATGFIGNYVVKALLQQNHQVITTSSSIDKVAALNWPPSVKYYAFDFNSFNENINYFRFFNEPDIVIHLAWQGLPDYKSEIHLKENLPKQLAFLSNLINNGLTDLTVSGTCFEYGMEEGLLSESMEARPANAYAKAKDELRISLEDICKKKEVSFKWARLFYMYGIGQNPKSLIPQLEKALDENRLQFNMSGGEQQRDFLHVTEVAAYIVAVALQKTTTGIINICSGKPVKLKDFVKEHLLKRKRHIQLNLGFYPYPDYEPMNFWGDNGKLLSILAL